MRFTVTVLGSGASIPTTRRNLSAHLVQVRGRYFLLDCGEGTQMQLRRYGIRFQRISRIFISHLHGDHYFGLIGLLTSFHLLGRQDEIHLYALEPLREIIDIQLMHSQTELSYRLVFHPIDPSISKTIYEDEQVSVSTIPLVHKIPTCGFLLREKELKRKVIKEFVESHEIPLDDFDRIKSGEDWVAPDGKIYPNNEITLDPLSPRSYAYCTDTAYDESIVPLIKGVDLLYHESTFLHNKAKDAQAKQHATVREAATIATLAGVKKLLLGHFSARYKETDQILKEARQAFQDTVLAEDGLIIEI